MELQWWPIPGRQTREQDLLIKYIILSNEHETNITSEPGTSVFVCLVLVNTFMISHLTLNLERKITGDAKIEENFSASTSEHL